MDEHITLRMGLDQFHEKNVKYFSHHSVSTDGASFLKDHDIAHIIFGCDTTIYGEGIVKIWATFGTTLSFWKVVRGYKNASAFALAKKYSWGHIFENILRLFMAIPKTIIRAKKMSKPWPFTDYEKYLDTPISEIRREFNIQVL